MDFWVNGEWCDPGEKALPPSDRGVQFGDGLFETLPVHRGVALFLEEHFRRMQEGARVLRFAATPAFSEWKAAVDAVTARYSLGEGTLRVTLTRGPGGIHRPLSTLAGYTLMIEPRARQERPEQPEELDAVISRLQRSPNSVVQKVKSLNFLDNIIALEEARLARCHEALFCNPQGHLVEGAISNIFLVFGSVLVTARPDGSFLSGITRAHILRLCARLGIDCREEILSPNDLSRADEAFLTNSGWLIAALCHVDGQPIGTGRPGPLTKRIYDAYLAGIQSAATM